MRTPRARWDAAWKALIEQVFHPWLGFFFPDVAALVCPVHPPRFLDTELQRIAPRAARGRYHVDRLVEVRFRSGRSGLFLIHVEIQSQQDSGFPVRLLYYHAALRLRYELPVSSLALLADSSADWKPTEAELTGPGTRLVFKFPVCKLLELDPGVPTAGEPALHYVVRAWKLTLDTSGDPRARQAGKIRLARALLQAAASEGCDPTEAVAALRFLETVAALPSFLEEEYEAERNQFMKMVDLDILTYGEKKAFRKGREAGRLEERREGARRMRSLGFDTATIAKAFDVSEGEAASLLATPTQDPGDSIRH